MILYKDFFILTAFAITELKNSWGELFLSCNAVTGIQIISENLFSACTTLCCEGNDISGDGGKLVSTTPTAHMSKKDALEIKKFSQRIWCTNRLLWHTNSDFYGMRTPTFMPHEPFLMGVGVVFNTIGQKNYYIINLASILDVKITLHFQKLIPTDECNVIVVFQPLGKQPGIHRPELHLRGIIQPFLM